MARRSVLFSPGDQSDLLRNALNSGADVVVFDLEDAVAPAAKAEARETVQSVVTSVDAEPELCVRINPLAEGGDADIEALAGLDGVDSVMLPKVSGPAVVARVRERLTEERLTRPILALVETAAGVLDAAAIAEAAGVDALLFGAEDLSADIGATRTDDGEEVGYARQRVVLAASAAGVDAIDTLVTDFKRDAHLRSETERAVQFGFDGKMAIHPAQVPIINDGFTPSEERIEWARRVVEAGEAAETADRGVVAVDGEMIDAPLIEQAEQVLERAVAAGIEP